MAPFWVTEFENTIRVLLRLVLYVFRLSLPHLCFLFDVIMEKRFQVVSYVLGLTELGVVTSFIMLQVQSFVMSLLFAYVAL
jgi:hypothetical protein